jgi:RNA-directed DNA polymerase
MRHAQGRAGECHIVARTAKQDGVRELQRTLYRAAKADPGRRFHALHDKVYRRDVLERAWELVRANRGAAGIDRTTIADVEQHGVSRLLDELAADLKDGRWRPLPARRVFIPKPGGQEVRPLSIPTVTAYREVVQRRFGFAGGDASVPSAARRAASGPV